MHNELNGWREAIPNPWQRVFEGVDLDFEAQALDIADDQVEYPAYPTLHGIQNGPTLFRPFLRIGPENVRVVVIAQDPYPDRSRATGRAFEDWSVGDQEPADSLKRLLQSAITCRYPGINAEQNAVAWNDFRDRAAQQLRDREAMTSYFDDLEDRDGVLFLNAAWTFTPVAGEHEANETKRRRDRIQNAHRALWKPVVQRLLANIAARDQTTVFLLLGEAAQGLLCGWDGVWRRSAIVQNAHPAAPGRYFHAGYINPLKRVNKMLTDLDEEEVDWWPFLDDEPND